MLILITNLPFVSLSVSGSKETKDTAQIKGKYHNINFINAPLSSISTNEDLIEFHLSHNT